MRLFDPDPNLRWLFCLTHPDDEISICIWIKRLAEAGNPVFLSWTHHNLVREKEGRDVAKRLGVPQENLFFHGATDGSVCDEIKGLLPKFESMMSVVKPDRVCCGAFEQGHLDHDATNYLVNHTTEALIQEIPFYHTYTTRLQTLNRFSDPRGEETFDLELPDQAFKRSIAKQYPSQNIWQVLFWYELSQNAMLRRMELVKTERMRLQTHRDFRSPNHPTKIARKVLISGAWQRWIAAMDNLDKTKRP